MQSGLVPDVSRGEGLAGVSCSCTLTSAAPEPVRCSVTVWSGAILRAMADGRTRFVDIAAAVPGLSDRMLSERLKELEAEGVVTRTVTPSHPVRIEYHLTQKGQDLGVVMDAIGDWAHRWLDTEPSDPAAAAPVLVTAVADPSPHLS